MNIDAELNRMLKELSFFRKSSTWYRATPAGLHVINLQRSAFGPQYYLNLCWVPGTDKLEKTALPREYQCPIRIRADVAFPEDLQELKSILDLEQEMPDIETRNRRLAGYLQNNLKPLWDRTSTTDGLRKELKNGRLKSALVMRGVEV